MSYADIDGSIIKRGIMETGLTQYDFCRKANIAPSTLWRIMREGRGQACTVQRIKDTLAAPKEFTPPPNDKQSYVAAITKHIEDNGYTDTIPLRLLKEASEVQHGWREYIDYSQYTCPEDTATDCTVDNATAATIDYSWLFDLLHDTMDSLPEDGNIWAAFGQAVYTAMRLGGGGNV